MRLPPERFRIKKAALEKSKKNLFCGQDLPALLIHSAVSSVLFFAVLVTFGPVKGFVKQH